MFDLKFFLIELQLKQSRAGKYLMLSYGKLQQILRLVFSHEDSLSVFVRVR